MIGFVIYEYKKTRVTDKLQLSNLVDGRGIEPLTSAMPLRRSPS